MRILGIETSCDETATAIVEDGRKILAHIVASSKELHEKTGGIIPEVAAREQVKCIIPVIVEALGQITDNKEQKTEKKGGVNLSSAIGYLLSNIDALAVTVGPGLIGSLLVGVETAKAMAYVTGKPIIPVNHIFAHIYANWLDNKNSPDFPAIALVISGGHTELFLMKGHNQLRWLGGTRDDAVGEAFDKTARILGLGYPGGPAISAAAEKFQITNRMPLGRFQIKLPRPMIDSDDLHFSFSGLKTAVIREINRLKAMKQFNNETIHQLAYEIQESITDVLVKKTLDAAKKYNVKTVLLGGGVSANQRLKEKLNSQITNYQLPITPHIPPPSLCTDNACYIASFAYFNYKPISWQQIQAKPNLLVEV